MQSFSQLHHLDQILSSMAQENQDGGDHYAKLDAIEQQSIKQRRTL